jgi:uncharacterized protein (DUF433 family)
MGLSNRIEINPDVMLGKPVIRGTRLTVELLLRQLSQGATVEDLLDAYPQLMREDIKAAIGYAADSIAEQRAPAAPRTRRKPRTALFKGPGGSTGQLIGDTDSEPTGDASWRSS